MGGASAPQLAPIGVELVQPGPGDPRPDPVPAVVAHDRTQADPRRGPTRPRPTVRWVEQQLELQPEVTVPCLGLTGLVGGHQRPEGGLPVRRLDLPPSRGRAPVGPEARRWSLWSVVTSSPRTRESEGASAAAPLAPWSSVNRSSANNRATACLQLNPTGQVQAPSMSTSRPVGASVTMTATEYGSTSPPCTLPPRQVPSLGPVTGEHRPLPGIGPAPAERGRPDQPFQGRLIGGIHCLPVTPAGIRFGEVHGTAWGTGARTGVRSSNGAHGAAPSRSVSAAAGTIR